MAQTDLSPVCMTHLSKSTNTHDPKIEQAIVQLAHDNPMLGQAAVAERLQQSGLKISASGVRYIWKKHGLETAVKRLQALTAKHEEGLDALKENERRLLERGLVTHQLSQAGLYTELGEDVPLERRQIILNAAAELFSEQGYNRTSMREIASKAGLLPGSVYHHFTSKEELFIAVHKEGFRAVMAKVQAAISKHTDPWESLRSACEMHVNQMFSGTPVDRLTGHSLAFTHNELLSLIKPERDAYEKVFKDLIAALPLAPDVDRSLLRLTLLGAMNWVFIWYKEGKRSTIEIADAIVDMIRKGVES